MCEKKLDKDKEKTTYSVTYSSESITVGTARGTSANVAFTDLRSKRFYGVGETGGAIPSEGSEGTERGTHLDKDKLDALVETVVVNLKTNEELDILIDIVERFRKVVATLKWYQ